MRAGPAPTSSCEQPAPLLSQHSVSLYIAGLKLAVMGVFTPRQVENTQIRSTESHTPAPTSHGTAHSASPIRNWKGLVGDKPSLSFPHSTPQSHRPTAPSKPRGPASGPPHQSTTSEMAAGVPPGGWQGFCCPHWPLYATSCPGPAPSSWPPGSPRPRLGPAGFPRPHTAHQGGQRPWSPVKSKHTHTPPKPQLPSSARGRGSENSSGGEDVGGRRQPRTGMLAQCCPWLS